MSLKQLSNEELLNLLNKPEEVESVLVKQKKVKLTTSSSIKFTELYKFTRGRYPIPLRIVWKFYKYHCSKNKTIPDSLTEFSAALSLYYRTDTKSVYFGIPKLRFVTQYCTAILSVDKLERIYKQKNKRSKFAQHMLNCMKHYKMIAYKYIPNSSDKDYNVVVMSYKTWEHLYSDYCYDKPHVNPIKKARIYHSTRTLTWTRTIDKHFYFKVLINKQKSAIINKILRLNLVYNPTIDYSKILKNSDIRFCPDEIKGILANGKESQEIKQEESQG